MNAPRFLDHDGLDGVLLASKAPSLYKYLIWIGLIVSLLAILLIVFWINNTKPDTADSIKDTLPTIDAEKTKSVTAEPHESFSTAVATQVKEKIKNISNNNLPVDSDEPSLIETENEVIISSYSPDEKSGLDKVETIADNHKNDFNDVTTTNISEIFLFTLSSRKVESLSVIETKRLTRYVNRCNNKVIIVGHTCNLGSAAFNYQLGLDRATAMYQYLITQGVNLDVLEVRSKGMEQPVANNATKSGRRLNRRVELLCIDPKNQLPKASSTSL